MTSTTDSRSITELLDEFDANKAETAATRRRLELELAVLTVLDENRREVGHDYGAGQRAGELIRRRAAVKALDGNQWPDVEVLDSDVTAEELLEALRAIVEPREARLGREGYRAHTPATRRTAKALAMTREHVVTVAGVIRERGLRELAERAGIDDLDAIVAMTAEELELTPPGERADELLRDLATIGNAAALEVAANRWTQDRELDAKAERRRLAPAAGGSNELDGLVLLEDFGSAYGLEAGELIQYPLGEAGVETAAEAEALRAAELALEHDRAGNVRLAELAREHARDLAALDLAHRRPPVLGDRGASPALRRAADASSHAATAARGIRRAALRAYRSDAALKAAEDLSRAQDYTDGGGPVDANGRAI